LFLEPFSNDEKIKYTICLVLFHFCFVTKVFK
jgi:hypothetical protein